MTHARSEQLSAEHAVDAVIVGAGFAGLYMLHSLRRQGLTVQVLEAGADVGGTWYWNRYPGARCDVESFDYSFSFDEQLEQEWSWNERYPAQPEILRYLQHVADRYDLRRDISLNTRVSAAEYDSSSDTWIVQPENAPAVRATYCIMATGCLSVPKTPDIPGIDAFTGEVYHTADWPKSDVDLAGKRVGVIGTGSSGVQVVPALAQRVGHLTVFQRTPAYVVPAGNHLVDADTEQAVKANYRERRRVARASDAGLDRNENPESALAVDEDQRNRELADRWRKGGLPFLGAYADILADQQANEAVAGFVRDKIREIVSDPDTAEKLIPHEYPFGTKRPCVEDNYYATFNRDNVSLVDLRRDPLQAVTATGVRTSAENHELDALVLATGFDAMTGALTRIDVRGRDGAALAEKWDAGPRTYLGLGCAGFPNMFVLAGPQSPSVLTNMVTSIEQHVEWVDACIAHLRRHGYRSIEPTAEAEDAWVEHVNDVAGYTLMHHANSWYLGANVPGKPRIFMPYVGGLTGYEQKCNDVADNDYEGFVLK